MSLPIEGGGGLGSICARAEVAPRATAARVALASRRAANAKGDLLPDMMVLLGVMVRSSNHVAALRRQRIGVTRARAAPAVSERQEARQLTKRNARGTAHPAKAASTTPPRWNASR